MSGARIWQGKNYRYRSPLNQVRTFLEIRNYSWLATAKHFANTLQNKMNKDSVETQTNL